MHKRSWVAHQLDTTTVLTLRTHELLGRWCLAELPVPGLPSGQSFKPTFKELKMGWFNTAGKVKTIKVNTRISN